MRHPVEIQLELDERRVGALHDDVVPHLPVLRKEIEIVIVIGGLEPRPHHLFADPVQPLRQ